MTDMKSRLHNNTTTRKANRMLGLSIEHVNGAGILKQQIRTNLAEGKGEQITIISDHKGDWELHGNQFQRNVKIIS